MSNSRVANVFATILLVLAGAATLSRINAVEKGKAEQRKRIEAGTKTAQARKVEEWFLLQMMNETVGAMAIVTEDCAYEGKLAIRRKVRHRIAVLKGFLEATGESTTYMTPDGRPLCEFTSANMGGDTVKTTEVIYKPRSLTYEIQEAGKTKKATLELPVGEQFIQRVDRPLCSVSLSSSRSYRGMEFDIDKLTLQRDEYQVSLLEEVPTADGRTERALRVEGSSGGGERRVLWVRTDGTRFEPSCVAPRG